MADAHETEENLEEVECLEGIDETIVHQEEPSSEFGDCVLCDLTHCERVI